MSTLNKKTSVDILKLQEVKGIDAALVPFKFFNELVTFINNLTAGTQAFDALVSSTTVTATTGLLVDSGTQIGSDTPTVSKPSGIITTAVTATVPQAYKTVTITNTLVTATSKVFVSLSGYGGTGIPVIAQVTPTANTITIKILNAADTGGLNLSAAMDLLFFVVN